MKILQIDDPRRAPGTALAAIGAAASACAQSTRVATAFDARVLLTLDRPDVILINCVQPDAMFLDDVSLLARSAPDVPLVVALGCDDEEFALDTIRHGAQDCLCAGDLRSTDIRKLLARVIERMRSARALNLAAPKADAAMLQTVADNLPALIAYVGIDERYRYVNKFHEEWFGCGVKELLGCTLTEVLGENVYEKCRPNIALVLNGERSVFELQTIKDGFEQFLQMVCIPQFGDDGKVSGFYILGNNITEAKLNEARLESIALYDALTGLANRLLLADRVSQAIAHAQRNSSATGIIYLDMDGFKEINDLHGHETGDLVLREIAERLVAAVRQEDTVARIGGDEFVVAMRHVATPRDAAMVAEKLIGILAEPYTMRGLTFSLTASAGVSIYPVQGDNLDALLRSADQAMYEAKRAGKNAYRIFDDTKTAVA